MKVHFIAIGGSAMHNLAIALHKKGFNVTGSDDEIFEPSKGNLAKYSLLPENNGWFPEKLNNTYDAVILGMHARADNPELLKAQELGLKIYSYPEYLYEQCKDKKRIVIGGSHGKTTITSMIMHVMLENNIDFDYMVGAQLEGFETMVKLTHEAKIAIFEGDEYLTSPIDLRPKFHLYKPHIALLSGVAWDHINVFPTFDIYVEQFKIFANLIEPNGNLIYFENDTILASIAKEMKNIKTLPYGTPKHKLENGITSIITKDEIYPMAVFGEHNLQNIAGSKLVCNEIGINDEQFYNAIKTFKGASKRLQLLASTNNTSVYLDFAHSPSKLKATTKAVKAQFPNRKLIACMELHTFSSLKEDFLPQYKDSMNTADIAYIYFNPHTIEHKKLKQITEEQVAESFGGENVKVFTNANLLVNELLSTSWENKNLLLMTSGNFSGIDFKDFAKKIIELN